MKPELKILVAEILPNAVCSLAAALIVKHVTHDYRLAIVTYVVYWWLVMTEGKTCSR